MHNLPTSARPPGTRPTGTVTFLFTDIEGSTRRWEANSVAMRQAFAHQEAIIRNAIEANGGYPYKMIGDAFQAAFPTALQALKAAIDAQHALDSQTWPAEIDQLKVRMALHTGVTEERGDDYVGPVLNRVARLLSAASGAQILLSKVTRDLIQDPLPLEAQLLDMGEHRLRDLVRPEHIFQVVTPDLPSEFPPLKTLDNHPNNLPLQPTPLIGRERELAEVGKLLASEEVKLLSLTGPGGTGKTRLALQVASDRLEEFPDGVRFVELASLVDAGLVASKIGQTLGLREAPGKPILDTLKDYLADKQVLLVLDNFEQVIGASGEVTELTRAAPRIKILVTSRVKLNIYGEHEYAVPPLSLPDINQLPPPQKLTRYEAVELFVERARAARADFEVNSDNASAVAEICTRLDGLPLAIELAAARVKVLPPQALLDRLSNRLKLLTGGARDLSTRQQTLRGTIDWSYNLLSGEEKQFFSRMAVFQGGYTLGALEEVYNLEDLQAEGSLQLEVLDGVQSLVDKSLLQQRESSDGEPRFLMLQTIHEYAGERLAETGELAALRKKHALYFMALVEEAEPHLTDDQQQKWLDRLEEESYNIRAALQWARDEAGKAEALQAAEDIEAVDIGLRIGAAVGRFWQVRGYYSEGREQLTGLLKLVDEQPAREANKNKARVLHWAGMMALLQGDYSSARSLFEEGLTIQQKLGDKLGIAYSLNSLGNVVFEQEDYSSARSLFEESLAVWRELGDEPGIIYALNNLGIVAKEQEDYSSARFLFEEGLAIARELGDKRGMGYLLGNLGLMAQDEGNQVGARSLFEQSLALFREVRDKWGIALSLAGLGGVDVGSADSTDKESSNATQTGASGEPIAKGATGASGARSDLRRGARLLGSVEALLQSISAVLAAEDRRPYERAVAQARSQLGEKEFEKAWAEGRAMSIDEAIECALERTVGSQP